MLLMTWLPAAYSGHDGLINEIAEKSYIITEMFVTYHNLRPFWQVKIEISLLSDHFFML